MSARTLLPWAVALLVAGLFGAILLLAVIGGSAQANCDSGEPSAVSTAGEPPLVQIYLAAAQRYGLGANGYAWLGSINDHESSFGTNMGTVPPDLAEGWMSFTPSTWSTYGMAVGHTGAPDPFNPYDAIYSAAKYLRANGAPGDWSGAVFAYNHAGWYVSMVTATEQTFAGPNGPATLRSAITASWGGRQPAGVTGKPLTQPVDYSSTSTSVSVGAAPQACCPSGTGTGASSSSASATSSSTTAASTPPAERGHHRPATATSSTSTAPAGSEPQSGGCTAQTASVLPVPGAKAVIEPSGIARPPASAPTAVQTLIAAGDRLITYTYSYAGGHCVAAMDNLADLDQCPGSEEHGGPGFDCSGATGWVLWQIPVGKAFLDDSPQASGAMMTEGLPGPGQWVTVISAPGHVFLAIAGIALDTSWQWDHTDHVAPYGNGFGPRWITASTAYTYEQDEGSDRGEYVMRHPTGL